MKYAKSIYRGGEVVDASICDYDSSKKLGLICPFCQESLYLRSGATYQRDNKKIITPPAFCHYQAEKTTAEDCELRSERKDGQDYLQKLRIEARNQRLEIFNERFWEIVVATFNVNTKILKKQCLAVFETKWIDRQVSLIRQELREKPVFYKQELIAFTERHSALKDAPIEKGLKGGYTPTELIEEHRKYSTYDAQLQQLIGQEAISWLSTKTAGYAMKKLLTLSCWFWSADICRRRFKSKPPSNAIQHFSKQIEALDARSHAHMILNIISSVNWISNLYSLDK